MLRFFYRLMLDVEKFFTVKNGVHNYLTTAKNFWHRICKLLYNNIEF
jgi:hypothetical protein